MYVCSDTQHVKSVADMMHMTKSGSQRNQTTNDINIYQKQTVKKKYGGNVAKQQPCEH